MGATDEISSTQRLLDLIRSKDVDSPAASPEPVTELQSQPASAPRRSRLARRAAVTVGVDIGPSDVKLAAVGIGSDRKARLLNWATRPLAPDAAGNRDRLSSFLEVAVADFCRDIPRPTLWGFVPAVNVETRFLKVPKVPARQLANAVLYAFRKESTFSEKADIFDYRVIGESHEDFGARLRVMASVVPRHDVEAFKRLFAKAGHRVAGATTIACALQNLFRAGWLETAGRDACVLFVGRDWSRIAIFSQGDLVLSREIKAGMQSMAEAIHQGLEAGGKPRSDNTDDEADLDADSALPFPGDLESAWRMLAAFIGGPASPEHPNPSEWPHEKIFQLIRPALDRIVRQMDLTFQHYQRNFAGRRVGCLFLSGQVCHQPAVENYFRQQVGIDTRRMDPFELADVAPDCPPRPVDRRTRSDFGPVIGLALAPSFNTSNFLHTYQEKDRARKIRRLDNGIWAGFALVMLGCIGWYGWLQHQNQEQARTIEALQQRLSEYSPRLDEHAVLALAGQTTRQVQHLSQIAERYRTIATIGEIGRLTPEMIRLVNLTIDAGSAESAAEKKAEAHLMLDGVILGERSVLDAAFADYLMAMAKSPLVGAPVVEKKVLENLADEEVMRFALRVPLK